MLIETAYVKYLFQGITYISRINNLHHKHQKKKDIKLFFDNILMLNNN